VASPIFGVASHFDISTMNCGDWGTRFDVTTNFRGSGLAPSSIQICQSTSALRNAMWSHRTPPTTDLPTTNAEVRSCVNRA
jgi:hypothetical protein